MAAVRHFGFVGHVLGSPTMTTIVTPNLVKIDAVAQLVKCLAIQWLSRWLKFRRSLARYARSGKDWKVERLTSCSRGARLSRDKELTEVVSL